MISTDNDRRAPALARHEMHADPGMLRETVRRVASDLEEVDGETRRRVALLLGVLANQWAQWHCWRDGNSLTVDIECFPNRVRVDAFSSTILPVELWDRIGSAVAAGLADRWGMEERQHRSGVWFELSAAEPSSG